MKWVGHRGLPAEYPENTLEGIIAACEAGAAGVEFDIQLSADGVPVLLHDESLLRTSGQNKHVADLTLLELQQQVVGEALRFNSKYSNLCIASLATVAQALAQYPSVKIFVELKQEPLKRFSSAEFLQRVASALGPIASHCVLISFSLDIVRQAQRMQLGPVGWVLKRYDNAALMQVQAQPVDYLICNYKKMDLSTQAPWPGSWQWFVYDVVEKNVMRDCLNRGIYWLETWDLNRAKQFANN